MGYVLEVGHLPYHTKYQKLAFVPISAANLGVNVHLHIGLITFKCCFESHMRELLMQCPHLAITDVLELLCGSPSSLLRGPWNCRPH